LSGFFEIAATLLVAAAVIWLPGAIVIKAIDHLRPQRNGGQRAASADRLGETR
jgi:hypothetical protein